MVKENTRYCRKIRIYPPDTLKELLNKCFGATRYVQNKALEYIEKNPDTSLSHISLRQNTMKSDKELRCEENKQEQWLSDVPYDTRQLALKQLASNFKTNFTMLKKNQITHFQMRYRSKRTPYQYCFVNKKAFDISNMHLFKRRIKDKIKTRRKMGKWIQKHISSVESDFIITREKNRYYMCLPMIKELDMIIQPYNRVALDPGVRTFQTFYSDQGLAGKIGHNICDHLIDIAKKEDNLKSLLKQHSYTKRTRYNLQKRCFILRTKIKNIVNDLHWKTANYLCQTFRHILLPSFEVSNMVRKDLPEKARVIGSKAVRKMLSLSHYAFKQKLLYMADVMGCRVDIVNEAYTTCTCGNCGYKNKDIGGNKIFSCSKCHFTMDRDYNGARNIMLKYY